MALKELEMMVQKRMCQIVASILFFVGGYSSFILNDTIHAIYLTVLALWMWEMGKL